MPKETSFISITQKMLDAWIKIDPEDEAAPNEVYRSAVDLLSIKMRLTVLHVDAADALDWRMVPVRHSGFTSSLFNINHTFREQKFREFKDQNYIADAVLPRLTQVIENQQPSIELVKTKLFGINLGYDRILIPQRTPGRPAWVISCTYGRFLLDTPKSYGNYDVEDEAVVQLLLEGCTAKEIAVQLGLSHRTVEHRLGRLKERFGARNTVHLVVMLLGGHVVRDTGTP